MNFSTEEIYFMYGQYDTFVMLEFHAETESYKLFGKDGIMGRFKYTLYERRKFEQLRGTEPMPRTELKIKFSPSEKSNFSENIQTLLDRDGFLCSDIACVNSLNRDKENRFIIKDQKKIPNQYTVTYSEGSPAEEDSVKIGFYKSRLKDGKLTHFEQDELLGLLMYYRPDEIPSDLNVYVENTKVVRDEIKMHFLDCKHYNKDINPEEEKERERITYSIAEKKKDIVTKEIKKNGLQINNFHDLKGENLEKAVVFAVCFDDEVILPYKYPVWCDFERLAHIFLGHVEELFIGNSNNRTFFQYSSKEVRKIIRSVVGSVYDEYYEAVSKNSQLTWGRRGPRAIEFDGHYYRVEIEPTGRLLTFHPYANFEEAKNDVTSN